MGDAQSSQETGQVVETPRDRIGKALRQQDEINRQLNELSSHWANGEITDYNDLLAKEAPLEQEKQALHTAFTQLVSHEPEAKAWVEVAKEQKDRITQQYSGQGMYGTTPTDKSWASAMISVYDRQFVDATENLARIVVKTPVPPVAAK